MTQEEKSVEFRKLARPPLPKDNSSKLQISMEASTQPQTTEFQRESSKYKDSEQGRELVDANLPTDTQELVQYFLKYKPESEFEITTVHKSTKTKLKRYKGCNYYGELVNNKREGKGVMLYSTGRLYEGDWQGDYKHGEGYERFTNKSTYKGKYVNGKPQGHGIFKWQNGEVYEGEWINGQKHGSGMWTGERGDSYIGEWKFGMADGYGVHTWINGDKYEGQFKSCLKHGEGVEVFANGDKYVGSYVNGKPSGYGEYYWKDGSFFKGQFKNGLRDGSGVWRKSEHEGADTYQGQYVNDKKCGYGIFTWAGGNIYKGNFFQELRHGYGEMYWSDGAVYKGNWENGVQHGNGQIVESAGAPPKRGIFQNNILVIEEIDGVPVPATSSAITNLKNFRSRKSLSANRSSVKINQREPIPQLDESQFQKPYPIMLSHQKPRTASVGRRSKILVSDSSRTENIEQHLKITCQSKLNIYAHTNCERCARKQQKSSQKSFNFEALLSETPQHFIRRTQMRKTSNPTKNLVRKFDRSQLASAKVTGSSDRRTLAVNQTRLEMYQQVMTQGSQLSSHQQIPSQK